MQPLPRRWRPNPWWILAAILLAAVGGIVHGLTRSDVPPRVGADTTVITQPLAADGLPDYAAHILALQGRGTLPVDNAAVMLLETFWPLEIDAAHLPAICAEIGIPFPGPPPGPPSEFDFPRIGKILDTLPAARPEPDNEPAVPSTSQPPADAHAETTATDPERDTEYRQQLDDWCSRHGTALDRATVAAQKPRLYLPPRRLLDCDRGDVMGSLQDGIGGLRSIAYALQLRALWRLHSGHTAAAWDDIHASCRLARRLAVCEQPGAATLVQQLVAMAISHSTHETTLRLFDVAGLPAAELAVIRRDLDALPRLVHRARMMDLERLMVIDWVLHLARLGPAARRVEWQEWNDGAEDDASLLMSTSIDWNVVLSTVNSFFDALEAGLRQSAWADRRRAIDNLDVRLKTSILGPTDILDAASHVSRTVLNRDARSVRLGERVAVMCVPSLLGVDRGLTEMETEIELTRVAAALAAFRAERRAAGTAVYPDRLDDLVPRQFAEVPLDPFTGRPFVYERRGDGYLLYSLGPDADDDLGTCHNREIIRGEWSAEENDWSFENDDIVIRLPLPDRARGD